MSLIIDAHAHFFPNPIKQWVPLPPESPLTQIRRHARHWLHPFTSPLHEAQAYLRYLPETPRKGLEEVSFALSLSTLLLESTAEDLIDAMAGSGVHKALVIAHPPFIPNEVVLETCSEHSALIPVVNIVPGTPNPGNNLRTFAKKGAKALKIHSAADGLSLDTEHYQELLAAAAELNLPIILHTGCMHSHLAYKDPALRSADKFVPWFKKFPNLRFILAHMNFHKPDTAMDLAQEYTNLYVDTSWQPTEVIGEAVRRIGPERLLFGTDWPFVGNNIKVGLKRIHRCIEIGMLKEAESELILGKNAVQLFGIDPN